jgi:transcriptional regulator with XRE-family HTH domain
MQKSLHSTQQQVLLALLRRVRFDRLLTQHELAERIGMSQSDISKVERGVRRLDVVELRAWVMGLGLSLGDFISELEAEIHAAELVHQQGRRPSKKATLA